MSVDTCVRVLVHIHIHIIIYVYNLDTFWRSLLLVLEICEFCCVVYHIILCTLKQLRNVSQFANIIAGHSVHKFAIIIKLIFSAKTIQQSVKKDSKFFGQLDTLYNLR